ncbi:MAG: cellulase family glycosylhydrolase [Pirellulales bacterium]
MPRRSIVFLGLYTLFLCRIISAAELPWIAVSADKRGFVRDDATPFRPWGFNYDHDEQGRLLEDYWDAEWSKVADDFAEMKMLGANVVRVHLQFGKFMERPDRPRRAALERLKKLLALAASTELYLDVTGLGCYHKADVPAWYDALTDDERWAAQAVFWEAVARTCADSSAVFCYDLMNEPLAPAGDGKSGDWLGPAFGGKHFVQRIALRQGERVRHDIARAWIARMADAIRAVDRRHLITVGLVDWSLDRPGLTSGFVPDKVAERLDFVAVHLYPESGKTDDAVKTLQAFAVGKPVIVEETFPLKCTPDELGAFMDRTQDDAAGWIGFYWGKTPEDLRKSRKPEDALQLGWLEVFLARGKFRKSAFRPE